MVDNLELKQRFFASLNERQKRQFAALEANELGYYGVTIISKLFSMNTHTIRRGQKELLEDVKLADGRIRRGGGGRKKLAEAFPDRCLLFRSGQAPDCGQPIG